MQDAHYTSSHSPKMGEINPCQKDKNSFLGYGVDIFQSRFLPNGPYGFIKAPILSVDLLHKKAITFGKSTFHLPNNTSIKHLSQLSQHNISSHSLLSMAIELGHITQNTFPLGAFHKEIQWAFSSFDSSKNASHIYGIHQHNQAVCEVSLPHYSQKELRSHARSDVIEVIDSFCMQPQNPQKKALLFSLFHDYGTFICTGALFGGTLRQEACLSNKNYPVIPIMSELAIAAYKEKTGASLSLNEAQALDFTDYSRQTRFSVRGGNARLYERLGSGRRHERESNFNQWNRSLHEGEQLAFIDFSAKGLIPIWHLARTSHDAEKVASVFQDWYHRELIQRELLPEIITRITLIEKDMPLDRNDNAGFTHRTGVLSQQDNRYLYLGYEKEPAHHVIKRKGSALTQLHLAPWKKWSEQYQRTPIKSANTNRLERITNQYDHPGDLAPGQPHQQLGTRLDARRETLTLDNIINCIQDIYIIKGPYNWVSPPPACNTLSYNLQTAPNTINYCHVYLSYLPVL